MVLGIICELSHHYSIHRTQCMCLNYVAKYVKITITHLLEHPIITALIETRINCNFHRSKRNNPRDNLMKNHNILFLTIFKQQTIKLRLKTVKFYFCSLRFLSLRTINLRQQAIVLVSRRDRNKRARKKHNSPPMCCVRYIDHALR